MIMVSVCLAVALCIYPICSPAVRIGPLLTCHSMETWSIEPIWSTDEIDRIAVCVVGVAGRCDFWAVLCRPLCCHGTMLL